MRGLNLEVNYGDWRRALQVVEFARLDRRMMGDPSPPVKRALSVHAYAYAISYDQ